MAKNPSKKKCEKMRKAAESHAAKAQKAWAAETKAFPKKLKEWAKVLENDWDSEPDYILIVLKYKLERTRKQLVKNDLTATTKKMENQILAVEKLLDKVIKDEYLHEMSRPHVKRWGRVKMLEKSVEGADHLVAVEFVYPKAKSKKQQAAADRQMFKIYDTSDKARKDDLRKAFELLQRDIWGWWD